MIARWAVTLAALAGCSAAAGGPATGGEDAVNLTTLAPVPYALYDLVPPAGWDPVPLSWEPARARFDAARAAYEAEDYRAAARGFLECAALLPRGPGPHAATLASDRAAAYRNAASAWTLAGATAEARAALEPLIADDPECAGPLREALARRPR